MSDKLRPTGVWRGIKSFEYIIFISPQLSSNKRNRAYTRVKYKGQWTGCIHLILRVAVWANVEWLLFFFFFFFLGVGWDWVHLARRPLIGLLYEHQMIDYECGALGGMRIGRGNRSTRRKPAPVPLFPPQILHDLAWARTRAAAVGSRRLTAWAMARPREEWLQQSGLARFLLRRNIYLESRMYLTRCMHSFVFCMCVRIFPIILFFFMN
jgi:hypothetical protein